MNPTQALTEKVGPLPAWAWGGIAGAGVVAWRFVRRRRDAAAGDAADAAASEAVASDGYTPPAAAPDLLSGRAINGSAAPDPTASYVEPTAPDWVLNPPVWYDQPPGFLLDPGPIVTVPADPPPADGPSIAPAPAPAPPAPAPAPAPVYLPTLGPWVVKPKNTPAGYRIVKRGDGKFIAVDVNYHN